MPAAVLSSLLADSERLEEGIIGGFDIPGIILLCSADLSAEMILGVQLVGVLVTEGVGEQIHSGPSVEHFESVLEDRKINLKPH